MNYILLLKALYESQIKYLLCDGLAVNIYGILRMKTGQTGYYTTS